VVQVGAGGIGHILAPNVVQFLAALLPDKAVRIVLCDGDLFEPRNTYRMDVPDFDNKAVAVATDLERRFGRPGLQIRAVPQHMTRQNVAQIIRCGDCVMLAVDNHNTRSLASERCAQLDDVVLISGGNDGVESGRTGTYGSVQVFIRVGGRDRTAPFGRFHPEIANPADRNPADVLDCMEAQAQGAAQLRFANLAVASAMCNALLRLLMLPAQPMYDEVCLDILEAISMPQWLSSPEVQKQLRVG
jgi:hypothetical protein